MADAMAIANPPVKTVTQKNVCSLAGAALSAAQARVVEPITVKSPVTMPANLDRMHVPPSRNLRLIDSMKPAPRPESRRPLAYVSASMPLVVGCLHCPGDIDRRKHHPDQGLDHAGKNRQPHHRERRDNGDQEKQEEDQRILPKDVPEETNGEGDRPGDVADDLHHNENRNHDRTHDD